MNNNAMKNRPVLGYSILMQNLSVNSIHLVFTVALKKEIPGDWIDNRGIPVYSLRELKSGAMARLRQAEKGILIIITGSGISASEEVACWIRDEIKPLFVINIGTCGLINKKYPVGRWIRPRSVADESDSIIKLDRRFPVHMPEEPVNVESLISVEKACFESLPEYWKKHDAVDMECYTQARVFHYCGIDFYSIKFATDYSDSYAYSDFGINLKKFRNQVKRLLAFGAHEQDNHKISVIIPVYNREDTINRAVDSALSQTRRPEEIIVVDDASTDRTRELLNNYRDKITVIFLPENSGPSKARNEGAKKAGTEWIAFLDSDDCWEKNKLQEQVEFLTRYPFYKIVQSEEKWIRNGLCVNKCKHHKMPEGWIFEQSLQRCMISPSGVLLRKSLLEKNGYFDESLPVCEDYDLWLKISRHHPVGLAPGYTVIKYGGHADQLSRKYPAIDRFRVQALLDLLEHEDEEIYRARIISVLKKKLNILIQGYEKRDKLNEAEEFKGMLRKLSA